MRIKLLVTLTISLLSFGVSALETDQYMTWEIKLSDSSKPLNDFINEGIEKKLSEINLKRKNYSCEEMTLKLLKFNKIRFSLLTRIENFVWDSDLFDKYPKTKNKIGVVNKSIYKDIWLFKVKIFGINLQANGVYFGIDKLSHFIDVGRSYYKIYNKHLKKGRSKEFALRKAVRRGIVQEKTYYGVWVSGIFSFADLEANYQGLEFARTFCEGPNPLLKKVSRKKWALTRKIDIKPFITPGWDESYNINRMTKRRMKKVRKYLKRYCSKVNGQIISERFAYYQSIEKENFSTKYLENLIRSGDLKAPTQTSLSKLCF